MARAGALAAALSVLALFAPACGGAKAGGGSAGPTGSTALGPDGGPGDTASTGGGSSSKGGRAPDFTLPTLDGKNVSLSDFTGKVVLLDFWSTTCDPCLTEMPHLVALYEKHKAAGFVVLAISADGPETRAQVSSVAHDKGMSFPVLLDEETSVIARYNPKKDMPFSALVDRSGNVVHKTSGYSPGDEKKLAAEVEKLLQAP